MKIISNIDNCPDFAKFTVAAIGNFDGVHYGHAAVINKAREIAAISGKKSAVITFSPHPIQLLRPEVPPFLLTNQQQKYAAIKQLGIEILFEINFNEKLSLLTADDFVKEILVKKLTISHIVTGANFIFGHKRGGNVENLLAAAGKYGFGYTKLQPVGNVNNNIFSSSFIRQSLSFGRLSEVKLALGRNFIISGTVVAGNKQGRIIGFPTINIELGNYMRPAFGVYAVIINIAGTEQKFYGAANIGQRPTINDTNILPAVAARGGRRRANFPKFAKTSDILLEVHIFNFSADIYGKTVAVELIEYIRPEQKFVNLEALKTQIALDCKTVERVLKGKTI